MTHVHQSVYEQVKELAHPTTTKPPRSTKTKVKNVMYTCVSKTVLHIRVTFFTSNRFLSLTAGAGSTSMPSAIFLGFGNEDKNGNGNKMVAWQHDVISMSLQNFGGNFGTFRAIIYF